MYALNRGVPFVWSNKQAQVSQDVLDMARTLMGGAPEERPPQPVPAEKAPPVRKSLFAWR